MPELPEVQTIVNDLNKKIKNETIVDFWSDWPNAIKNVTYKKFKKDIKNKKIKKIWRKGKNIFIDLSGDKVLYLHLKMTGHLLVKTKSDKNKYFKEKVNQYIHHIWKFKDGKTLEFSDLRKFGKILLIQEKELEKLREIERLGEDAMSKNFTLDKFREIIKKKSQRPIGIILMDQDLIAGIGNIYRSEILFDSKVNPKRKAKDLNNEEIKKIFVSIKKILEKAIKLRGTSDSDYRDTSGAPGKYQEIRKVYRKEGESCPRPKCEGKIKREKLAQRSIFFCPGCQK